MGEVRNFNSHTWILQCKIGSLPLSYLGLSLGSKYKSKKVWDHVVEKIDERLNLWKAALLSKCGWLTLVKSSFATVPNYFLLLVTISISVVNRIERRFRNVLWNDLANHHWYHLVDWRQVCRPFQEGGLGIKPIRMHSIPSWEMDVEV